MKLQTAVDLYAGAGIGAVGFSQVFDIQLAIDNNPAAVRTYTANLGNHAVCADLGTNAPVDLIGSRSFDVLLASPPCKGFSDARGKRYTFASSNMQVFRVVEWIAYLRPKVVIFENVAGINTIGAVRGDRFMRELEDLIRQEGYYVESCVLNAGHYLVPQKRERLILIALRDDLGISEKFHPLPLSFVPYGTRGQYRQRFDFGDAQFTDQDAEAVHTLLNFTSVEQAFFGLPVETTSSGIVPVSPTSHQTPFLKFVLSPADSTTNHIAKPVKPVMLPVVQHIPQGKCYRSNRFGNTRYLACWELYPFDPLATQLLKLLGRNQTKKSVKLGATENGYVPLSFIQTSLQQPVQACLANLLSEGWILEKAFDDVVGYRLSEKAGGNRQRYDRLNSQSLAPTVISFDFNGRDKLHPIAHRGLSHREGARLQTVPDGFTFHGSYSEVSKLIGNGLPSLLAWDLGRHLQTLVTGLEIPFEISQPQLEGHKTKKSLLEYF